MEKDEDREILKVEDPNKLTTTQLKALLSEDGVELPTTKQPKSTYVEIFNERKEEVLEKIRKAKEAANPPTTPPRKRKLRHSINVFQSGSKKSLLTDDEEQTKKAKKRKSLGNVEEDEEREEKEKMREKARKRKSLGNEEEEEGREKEREREKEKTREKVKQQPTPTGISRPTTYRYIIPQADPIPPSPLPSHLTTLPQPAHVPPSLPPSQPAPSYIPPSQPTSSHSLPSQPTSSFRFPSYLPNPSTGASQQPRNSLPPVQRKYQVCALFIMLFCIYFII